MKSYTAPNITTLEDGSIKIVIQAITPEYNDNPIMDIEAVGEMERESNNFNETKQNLVSHINTSDDVVDFLLDMDLGEMAQKPYYNIDEVSKIVGEQPSVLCFWESEFMQIHPLTNKRGAHNYTSHDIDILRRIHYLTRECGYTLEGIREQMRTHPLEYSKMKVIPRRAQRCALNDVKFSV